MKALRGPTAFEKFKTPGKSRQTADDETRDDVHCHESDNCSNVLLNDESKKRRNKIVLPGFKKIHKNKTALKGGNDDECKVNSLNFELVTDTHYPELKPPSSPDYVASFTCHTASNNVGCVQEHKAPEKLDDPTALSPEECLNDLMNFENNVSPSTAMATEQLSSKKWTAFTNSSECQQTIRKEEFDKSIKNEFNSAPLKLLHELSSSGKVKNVDESRHIKTDDLSPEQEILQAANALVSWIKECKIPKEKRLDDEKKEALDAQPKKKEKVLKSKIALKQTGNIRDKRNDSKSDDVGTELQYKTPSKSTKQQTTVILPSNQQSYCEVLTTSPTSTQKMAAAKVDDFFAQISQNDPKNISTEDFVASQFNVSFFSTNSNEIIQAMESSDDDGLDDLSSFGPKALLFPDTSIESIKNVIKKSDTQLPVRKNLEETVEPSNLEANKAIPGRSESDSIEDIKSNEKSRDSLDAFLICGDESQSFETFNENNAFAEIPVTEVETEEDSSSWSNGALSIGDETRLTSNKKKMTASDETQPGKHIKANLAKPQHESHIAAKSLQMSSNLLASEHILLTKTSDMIQSFEKLINHYSSDDPEDSGEINESSNDETFKNVLKSMVKDIILGHDGVQIREANYQGLDIDDKVDERNLTSPTDVSSFPSPDTALQEQPKKASHIAENKKKILHDESERKHGAEITQLHDSLEKFKLFPTEGVPTISERIALLQMNLQKTDK